MNRNKWITRWFCITMMSMILWMGACTTHPDDTAYMNCLHTYQEAHLAQDSAMYPKAIAIYKQCINECSSDKYDNNDSVKVLLSKTLVQLVNAYQSASMPNECTEYFDSLRTEISEQQNEHQNSALSQDLKRDVYVLLSYAMSRTDREEEAARIMDSALEFPLSYPTPERKFSHYAYAAAVYYCVPEDKEKAIKYGRLALEEIKHCQNKSGAQWLVAITAKLYQDKGEIGKAIAMCHEGFDLAEICKDTLGMANSKKELAEYLYQWKLYDDADKYISDAITLMESTNNSNPMVEAVAYAIKAKTLLQKGNIKDAKGYLEKARATCDGLPYNSGLSDIELLMGKILVSDTTEQLNNAEKGMKMLERVSHEATYKLRAQAFFELAKANLHRGETQRGEAALDSLYSILHSTESSNITIEGAYDFALNHYLQRGNTAQITRYASAINELRMDEEKRGTIRDVIKSLARFEMDKQEAEIHKEKKEMETRKIMEIVGIILGAILLGGIFMLSALKRKKLHKKQALTEQALSNAQTALSDAQTALSDAQTALSRTTEEKATAEELLKNIKQKDVEKVKAGISLQQLLDVKGEENFKGFFCEAYPHFIPNLRKKVGHLTSKEELYCMLIALNISNEELASTFNVARSSVVVAKYRIRKKLNLADGISMEAFLAKELTGETE